MTRFTLKDLGHGISLRAARDYLTRHGWHVSDEEKRIVCEGPPDDSGRPIVRILPPSESYSDYLCRLEDLISTLSVLEERPALEVAAEMARGDEPAASPTGSLADELIHDLSQSGVQLAAGKDPEQVINELRPLVANVEREISQVPVSARAYAEQAAFLAARLAKFVVSGDASKLLLWRFCERILATAGFTLRLSPKQVDEFFALALKGSPEEPDDVLEWINDQMTSVRTRAQGGEDQTKRSAADAKPTGAENVSGGPPD